jgi:hypothetical protein
MFKRVRWTLFGAAAGVGGSIWAQRKIRRQVARYLPDQVVSDARARVARTTDDVRAAVAEGRAAMVEREAELRAQLRGETGKRPPGRGEVIEARSFELGADAAGNGSAAAHRGRPRRLQAVRSNEGASPADRSRPE